MAAHSHVGMPQCVADYEKHPHCRDGLILDHFRVL